MQDLLPVPGRSSASQTPTPSGQKQDSAQVQTLRLNAR
nr:hypothetical protein [Tanacetum cinerariifolium]